MDDLTARPSLLQREGAMTEPRDEKAMEEHSYIHFEQESAAVEEKP